MRILERHWFGFLLFHAFVLQAVVMLMRLATTYQAIAIGLDAFWIGVIGGAFALLPAVMGLHMGRLIDTAGEITALIAGSVAILAASAGLWLLPHTLPGLLAMSALTGVGLFFGIAGQHSAVGRSETSRRAADFGWLTMTISLAHASGPLAIGLFAQGRLLPEAEPIFLTSLFIGVVLLAGALLIRLPHRQMELQTDGVWRTTGMLMRTPGFLLATLASLVIFSALDLLIIYLPLYGAENGITATTVGALLTVRAIAMVISRLFFGRLYSLLGRSRLLILALFVSGIPTALVTASDNSVFMGVMLFVSGLGLGVGAPLTLAWISDVVPSGRRGSALALRLAINRIGQAALPIVSGAAVSVLGAAGVIHAMASVLLLSGLAFLCRPGGKT